MPEDRDGIWVVWDPNTPAYPLIVFPKDEEDEAREYHKALGYGHVRFLPFGEEWGAESLFGEEHN